MDNCSSHKVAGIVEEIEKVGAKVLYLPPYSPDLNPIELLWFKVKSYLRKVKDTTLDGLEKSINIAMDMDMIIKNDIKNWFENDGYVMI